MRSTTKVKTKFIFVLPCLVLVVALLFASCGYRDDAPIIESPTYILNKSTLVYHDPDCKYLPAEKNQVEIEYADIEHNPEYRPCGHCKPE